MKQLRLWMLLLLVGLATSLWAQEPVRILAVGNSFAQDAVEQNLHELAAAEGIQTIIANMYIGGCSLERHLNNARENRADYAYRKIDLDGVKRTRKGVTLAEALVDEEWDYVSVQQVSGQSGNYASYAASLPDLLAYLRAHLPAKTEIVLHQTWAYASDSKHKDFVHYHHDQQEMFRAIVDANKRVSKAYKLKRVVPSGVAVQRARGKVGDCLTRDGYHLDLTFGRYVAACTWFETIFGRSVVGNAYAPEGVDADRKKVAQQSAHKAKRRPHAKRF
jgi:hypothetical protein